MRRRPAAPDDLAWASAITLEGVGPWIDPDLVTDEATFRAGIAERLVGAEVIEADDGERVGWLRVLEAPDLVRLDQVFLAAGWRGRGLGEALVREVLARAGPRPVELRVLKANPAHRLYARLGFRAVKDGGRQWHLRREPGWDGPIRWEDGRAPTAAEVDAVLARLGLRGPAIPLPRQGRANLVYAVGDVVLRIGTATPDGFSDARTEAAAVPPAVAAGVRTPPLLAFDETGRDLPAPFTVYPWVDGASAADAPAAVWREVGREVARVHAIARVPDGAGWLDRPEAPDLEALLPRAAALDPALPERLARWAATLPGEGVPPRFLHGDLHADNVLARDGRLAALIDWGDAGWGDPALEFEAMPIRAIPDAVAGWREVAGAADPTLEGRILRACLAVALQRIARPKPGRRPTARLEELLAFCASAPPGWASLTRGCGTPAGRRRRPRGGR